MGAQVLRFNEVYVYIWAYMCNFDPVWIRENPK